MLPVSLVVIVKNSEASLKKCLDSVPWVSDKVVVDSGSTDNTIRIAEECGARVIHQDWLGFGPQKNFAIRQASNDWVLCLDADEYLSPELALSIRKAIEEQSDADAFVFARCNKFLGRFLRHGEGYPDWNLRLFKRTKARWSDDLIHEHVVSHDGKLKTKKISGDLMHESAEDIGKYVAKNNLYTDIQARLIADNCRSVGLEKILISPFLRFLKHYFLKLGFLDGIPGLIHILIGCFTVFLKYSKAMAILRNGKSNTH